MPKQNAAIPPKHPSEARSQARPRRTRATLATDLNRQGYDLAGEDMGEEANTALAAIDAVQEEPGLGKAFTFERGQIQMLNNRRLGHRRTAYTDSSDPALKRHLVRIWLRDHGRPFYHG